MLNEQTVLSVHATHSATVASINDDARSRLMLTTVVVAPIALAAISVNFASLKSLTALSLPLVIFNCIFRFDRFMTGPIARTIS